MCVITAGERAEKAVDIQNGECVHDVLKTSPWQITLDFAVILKT